MQRFFRGFITALQTLTQMPIPCQGSDRMTDSLFWFPVVGALVGGGVTLIAWAVGGLGCWPEGAGVLAVVISTWLTRGLHLDGLADAADGLYGGHTQERRLDIMKDPHVGAFGVMALVLALAAKIVALSRLSQLEAWSWIPLAFILSRLVQVMMAVVLPYARVEGGKAEAFVKAASVRHFAMAGVMALALSVTIAGWGAIAPFLLALLFGHGLAWQFKRTFGGVTGDLLGTASDLTETMLLMTLAFVLPLL